MKKFFILLGSVGVVVIFILSLTLIQDPFAILKSYTMFSLGGYYKFFVYWVWGSLLYLLLLWRIYCLTKKIIQK